MKDKKEPSQNEDLDLSIVVAIIAGGRGPIEVCLSSLEKHLQDARIEIIVPYDSRLSEASDLAEKFSWAQFIDATDAVDAESHGAASREHHDVLRAIGLRKAKAPIVALLEDHGTPSDGWVPAVLQSHGASEAAAIGGAVENGVDRLLNWAVYYCDFGRYQNPLDTQDVEYLSDSNVSYKREALWKVKDQWFDAFQETMVNWAIKKNGDLLELNPTMVVFQTRKTLRLLPALKERFVWGRSFAGTRARDFSIVKRALFSGISVLLPFILTLRIVTRGLSKKRFLSKLFLAVPLIFMLETLWSAGEFAGYLTGRATISKLSDRRTSKKVGRAEIGVAENDR